MEEQDYDLTRPVLDADLRLGLIVWSTMMHAKMEVSALTESVVQMKLLTGGKPLTLMRSVLNPNSTMFYHLAQAQADEMVELRAIAHQMIGLGRSMLEKLNTIAEKQS